MTASAAASRASQSASGALLSRQVTALNGFRYSVRDAVTDHEVGEIIWPAIAQAKNARLRLNRDPVDGEVSILHRGKRYGISHEFLDRGWVNDVRYTLLDGQTQLAVAEMCTERRIFARAKMRLLEPVQATFERRSRFPKMTFDLRRDDGTSMGTIGDRAAFMTVREMVLDLPDSFPVPTKMFALFLALHMLQTQA